MDDGKEIGSIVKHLSKTSDEVYAKVCEVLEVDESEKTVDVKPIDGTSEIFNVRLQAESEAGGLVLIPKVGSVVLVVFLNKNNAAVVNTSAITGCKLKIGNCELLMDADGFLLRKENETLKKLMGDLIQAIKAMSFLVSTTGTAAAQTGATNTLNNSAQFTAIETRINQFLK
ncbi:hypothetical protein [Flavobacterium soyangense]|uniref:Uncharacterized protein n=1 Tax=Flavobacterium soyangense TaxID=2023265 RepID=A0A930U8R0_9FLAO|nr:hypothetical protein [Flavobacterium soyangense]MBF2708786.1 hypothetical protein [Flavobacterium soyangense]